MKKSHLLGAVCACVISFSSFAAPSVNYIIIDLGTLPGMEGSGGSDINNSGMVTGTSYNRCADCEEYAFLYDGSTMHDLGVLMGATGVAKTKIHAEGTVFVNMEDWSAQSDDPISAGDKVQVVGREGLILQVQPLPEGE